MESNNDINSNDIIIGVELEFCHTDTKLLENWEKISEDLCKDKESQINLIMSEILETLEDKKPDKSNIKTNKNNLIQSINLEKLKQLNSKNSKNSKNSQDLQDLEKEIKGKPFLIYDLESKLFISKEEEKKDQEQVWFTVDKGVIEVIIKKMSYEKYKKNDEFLKKIYDSLKKKLTINNSCMTHINIDFNTGFKNSYKTLVQCICDYEAGKSEEKLNDINVYRLNSPIMQDLVKKNIKFEKLLDTDEIKIKSIKNLNELKDYFSQPLAIYGYAKLNKTLPTELEELNEINSINVINKKVEEIIKIKKIIKDENIKKDSLHYRAVNIEHLDASEDDEKRVEFRCNFSKDTYENTKEQIDDIIKIVKKNKEAAV